MRTIWVLLILVAVIIIIGLTYRKGISNGYQNGINHPFDLPTRTVSGPTAVFIINNKIPKPTADGTGV